MCNDIVFNPSRMYSRNICVKLTVAKPQYKIDNIQAVFTIGWMFCILSCMDNADIESIGLTLISYIYIYHDSYTGLILGLRPANERRRYNVTPSLIRWAQTSNQPWYNFAQTKFTLLSSMNICFCCQETRSLCRSRQYRIALLPREFYTPMPCEYSTSGRVFRPESNSRMREAVCIVVTAYVLDYITVTS